MFKSNISTTTVSGILYMVFNDRNAARWNSRWIRPMPEDDNES